MNIAMCINTIMAKYPELKTITAVVLAGGKARRFAGQDKGLVQFMQRPIIEHVINAIEPQVSSVVINANRNQQAYAAFGYPVISDELADYQGPLAGFSTAMKYVATPYIITLPCDGPMISADYASRMISAAKREDVDLVVAHDGERIQPVHALISIALVDSLDAFMASGERKIDRWFTKHKIALADFSDSPQIFENINTKEELEALEKSHA